jgi:chromosomal replication initiation ATPase DnaA
MNDLQQHYKAVRARLWAGAPPPPPPPVVVRPPPPPPRSTPTSDQFREAHELLKVAGVAGVPKWKLILREVCTLHSITMDQLTSHNRSKKFINARMLAYYRLHKELGLSLPQIGRYIGDRDHSTVYYGIKRYESNLRRG